LVGFAIFGLDSFFGAGFGADANKSCIFCQ
jgi:hypothetical protein